ncbi:MAG TPA: HlyD family secretion protein [Anaeromyxobacteraceae bacterium]|nr:HlyD family secretion protein [Anaeromyxobacteraceae bacterium]
MAEPAVEPSRDDVQSVTEVGALRKQAALSKNRRLLVIGGIATVVILAVLFDILIQAGVESTDDAQIDADVVVLALRVAGQVTAVPIAENQAVRRGDLILQLDQRDYQARLARAVADLDSARAQADAADSQVAVAEAAARGSLTEAQANLVGSSRSLEASRAQVEQNRATLSSRDAELRLAEVNLRRARELQNARAIPQQQVDLVQAQYHSAKANREAARASVNAASEQLRRAQALVAESEGRVAVSRPVSSRIAMARANTAYQHALVTSAEATLALASLNLDWTRLLAPDDGVVSGITSHSGAFVAVGQSVAQFVPDKKYVTADFKETQVGKMRLGQRTDVEVDTYGRTIHGKVESLSAGTGARFSLLPPDNATGNFVKIAQRIPVRISLDGVPSDMSLRAGQSVSVKVHVGN